ncbi:MAG: hypothetical protein HC914_18185 [Chloroflexaceae bacterium]|nr:hypothetical protein [Chloroflexaceae bacterium]
MTTDETLQHKDRKEKSKNILPWLGQCQYRCKRQVAGVADCAADGQLPVPEQAR